MKQGTFSKDKHEILFQRFKINYDKEDEVWKKGSVVYRKVGTWVSRLDDANED
jgi:tRNA(His) 5'-end guanylyltransferase